jgi:hypothetical protein
MSHCPFSESSDVPQNADEVSVECPECGARWKRRHDGHLFYYPRHNQLDGTTRNCRHYKRVNGIWQIVEKET